MKFDNVKNSPKEKLSNLQETIRKLSEENKILKKNVQKRSMFSKSSSYARYHRSAQYYIFRI